jgi:hypothetical protein
LVPLAFGKDHDIAGRGIVLSITIPCLVDHIGLPPNADCIPIAIPTAIKAKANEMNERTGHIIALATATLETKSKRVHSLAHA